MTLAREPVTEICPSIKLGLELVTWLTMVRALMPTLFSVAPATPTLKEL